MNFLKKNIKMIIGILVGIVLVSGISVYATTNYLASQVTYKDGKSVEEALNDLYADMLNETDEFANKPYTQTGIFSYNNRVTITDGGYYTDNKGVTWVNLTFNVNTTLKKNDIWIILEGLPTVNGRFIVTDTNKQHAFYIGTNNGYDNAINFFDHGGSDLPANTSITLQFKY